MVVQQNAASLTKAIFHQTNLPFPKRVPLNPDELRLDPQGPTSRLVYDSNEHLQVSVCSEFTEHVEAASPVNSKDRLAIIQDDKGNPIILSVGTDHRLYTIRHVPGAANWESHDITPTSTDANRIKRVTTFDAVQDVRSRGVNLIVSLVELGAQEDTNAIETTYSEVYAAINLTPREGSVLVTDADWFKRPSSGQHVVTSIRVSCAPTTHSRSGGTTHPFAIVGTRKSDSLNASEYRIELDPASTGDTWSHSALAQVSNKVIALEPALLPMPFKDGSFALFQASNADDGVAKTYGPDAADQCTYHSTVQGDAAGYHIDILLGAIGGMAYDILAIPDHSQNTDLLIAGQSGLGFYRANKMGDAPIVILSGIVFRQVYAAQTDLRISILAVSDHGALYFAEGIRTDPNSNPVFSYSGVPIRQGIQHLAIQRNSVYSVTDTVYVNDQNQLTHLVRDSSGSWVDQGIYLSDEHGEVHYPSYISTINLTSVSGLSAPADYPINIISSDVVRCSINGHTHILSSMPTTVHTDRFGSLYIITQTPSSLFSPQYTLKLVHENASSDIPIFPAQRLLTQLAKIKTLDDLTGSTNTKGKPTAVSKIHPDKLKHAVPLLSQLGNIFTKAIPQAVENLGESLQEAGDEFVATFEQIDGIWHSSTKYDDTLAGAAQEFMDFVGDVFETVATTVAATMKLMIRLRESVFMFVVEVGGAVLKFAVNTLATCVRSLGMVLKLLFDIDINDFLDWLGYVLDMDNIKATAEVLTKFTKNGMNLLGDSMDLNYIYIKEAIGLTKAIMKMAIPDYKGDKPAIPDDLKPSTILKDFLGAAYYLIFNNPIQRKMREILERILSALVRPFADMISVPGVMDILDIIRESAMKIFGAGAKAILDTLDDIADKLVKLLTDDLTLGEFFKELFSDTFWSLFDFMTEAMLAIFAVAGPLLKAFAKLFADPWKLPFVTKLWQYITGMDLSVLNVVFVPVALVLNIASYDTYGALPFDVLPDPSLSLPTAQSCAMNMKDFEPIKAQLRLAGLLPKDLDGSADNAGHDTPLLYAIAPQPKMQKFSAAYEVESSFRTDGRLVTAAETPTDSGAGASTGDPGSATNSGPGNSDTKPEDPQPKPMTERCKLGLVRINSAFSRFTLPVASMVSSPRHGLRNGQRLPRLVNVGLEMATVRTESQITGGQDPLGKHFEQELKDMQNTPDIPSIERADYIGKLANPATQRALDVAEAKRIKGLEMRNSVLTAVKAVIFGAGFGLNIASVVALIRYDEPDQPDKTTFLALKWSGVGLSLCSFMLGMGALKMSDEGMAKTASAVAGILSSTAGVLSSSIPGFIEFSHDEDQDEYARWRVSGDSFEVLAQVSSGVATLTNACEQKDATLAALVCDAAFTIPTVISFSRLLHAYNKNEGLE